MAALLSTSVGMPALAQTRPTPPTPTPYPGGPAIQPPRPDPVQPPRPTYPGGPAIQPPRPTYPGGPAIQPPRPGNGYGQTIRCESRNNRQQRCAANTQNRVTLVRRLGGNCVQGRSWGYDQRSIWVDRGCRAEFSYGRGAGNGGGNGGGGGYPYPQPQPERDKGPSTALIIGGVAVAAGLVALLASSGKKKESAAASESPSSSSSAPGATDATFPPGPPAALTADLSPLPSAARPSVQTCLSEAARQIGATGGTRLRYDKLVSLEPGNGGWRFGATLTATYPDGPRELPLYCRATPSKVIQLDFAAG
jgi:hypothetical protein